LQIDASGAERPEHRYYRDFADGGASHPYATDAGFADFAGADDVLSEIFGRGGRANLRMRGGMFIIASNSTSSMQSMAQSGSSRFLTNRRSTSPFPPGTGDDGSYRRLLATGMASRASSALHTAG
jgi:hypothetical protein